MAEEDDLWSSVPWQRFPPDSGSSHSSQQLAWHKHHVPYTADANALQNLDIWIPCLPSSPKPQLQPPLSAPPGVWVLYIHGGAWRDPLVSSASFTATVEHILKSHQQGSSLSNISGFASINYSLSPHPNHPAEPDDASRNAKHPDHIVDVLRGLAFLQRKHGFGSNYILLGHSCGATLAFQALLDAARWGVKEAGDLNVTKPKVVVGLNGLYDLPTLVHDPGDKYASLIPIYAEFTEGAFGKDETVWRAVSPAYIRDWAKHWGRSNGKAVLVQSKEDSLVPYRQLEDMTKALEASKSEGVEVIEMVAGGDHNELWERGDQLAEIVEEIVKML